jgi:hypothetical protein
MMHTVGLAGATGAVLRDARVDGVSMKHVQEGMRSVMPDTKVVSVRLYFGEMERQPLFSRLNWPRGICVRTKSSH